MMIHTVVQKKPVNEKREGVQSFAAESEDKKPFQKSQ